ncbi:TolC family protein [uncultured Ilyobacter sp.]|uniref:TolC family protein n=1 Tax=uncultured Ilyobacter sp. TaxID=544433 RepID=UPI0029C06A18|nr:TolC family protein [uncultured Ilyobacter sp.]
MKKLTILSLSMILSLHSYALTLDEMIKDVEKRGYSKEFKEFEENRLEIEKIKIDRINRDGIDLEAESDYSDSDDGKEFDSSLTATYDFFKYYAEFDHEDGESEEELFGVEKDLRDIFYSEKKYSSAVFSYDKDYRLNIEEETIEEEVLGLITLYQNYMDKKLELELKEKLHPRLVKDMENLKKEVEIGTGTEFDYRYSEMLVENSISDIEQLKKDIEKLKVDFYDLYKVDTLDEEIENLAEIPNLEKEDFNGIGERSVENSKLLIEKSKENYKYSKYENKWPSLTAGTFYDTVSDGWVVSLELSKTLFEYDDTSNLYQLEIQELELERDREVENSKNLKKDFENQYYTLVKDLQNLERENKLFEMKYEIYKMKYEQGSDSYINYAEKYDEYVENSVELERKRNELNALIYEIKYRR